VPTRQGSGIRYQKNRFYRKERIEHKEKCVIASAAKQSRKSSHAETRRREEETKTPSPASGGRLGWGIKNQAQPPSFRARHPARSRRTQDTEPMQRLDSATTLRSAQNDGRDGARLPVIPAKARIQKFFKTGRRRLSASFNGACELLYSLFQR
jgi:hypothetical protein